ncbi:uncharacterized protein KZ484_001492 [Pholidichthys leucotaenia]
MEEQQEPEPPRVKEEEEEVFISQEGEQPEVKLEADMVAPISEENEQSGAEPNEAPQPHDCKEEEVLTVQQFWSQESNSRLGQDKQDAAQVTEEEEELSTSQEEEDVRLKQEADTFMVTPTDEDNDNNETEPK